MKIKIITVAHKSFDTSVLPDGYFPIYVGGYEPEDKREKDKTYFLDNEGENIASQNPWYCELTAQYWAWKNLTNEDVLGIVHYRRYFMNFQEDSKSFSDDILRADEIQRVFESGKFDIIVPLAAGKFKDSSVMYKKKPMDDQDPQWVIIYKIIEKYYPEYLNAFTKVIYGKKQYWWNMLIAKQDVFTSYCEWLFGVLKKYDKYVSEELHKERIPRVDGFLAELLPMVWIEANIDKKRVKHFDVENTESNHLSYDSKSVNNMIRKAVYCHPFILRTLKNVQMYVRILKNFYIS